MSAETEQISMLADADEIEARAASWLQRRQFWDWTEKDQAGLDLWLAQSAVHLVTYLRLEAAWARAGRLVALRTPAHDESRPAIRNSFWPLALKTLAALIVVAALGAAGATYVLLPRDTIYQTPVGGHRTVTLADNSLVELNTDTVLRVHGRTAKLEKGEAYFQIKHDATRTFVIFAGDHRIADLGNKFLVRNEPGRLEVSLMEGKALVESTSSAQPQAALLAPGDVVVATAGSMSLIKKPAKELANKLGWRQGLLIFKHTTLSDAASEFNRYNDQKLIIADASVGRLKIYGTFRAGNVEQFAVAAQQLLGLRLAKTGSEIVISR